MRNIVNAMIKKMYYIFVYKDISIKVKQNNFTLKHIYFVIGNTCMEYIKSTKIKSHVLELGNNI